MLPPALPVAPKTLLLLDATGASVTAAGMVFVIAPLERLFGFPSVVAYGLGGLGILFCLFSSTSALRKLEDHRGALKAIALANLAYCMLSVVLMALYRTHLTALGWLYLSGEILIVIFLARYELRVAIGERS